MFGNRSVVSEGGSQFQIILMRVCGCVRVCVCVRDAVHVQFLARNDCVIAEYMGVRGHSAVLISLSHPSPRFSDVM